MKGPVVRVGKPGALTTIQDCGRAGYAHLGVPRSGALDAPAHHRANLLVRQPAGRRGPGDDAHRGRRDRLRPLGDGRGHRRAGSRIRVDGEHVVRRGRLSRCGQGKTLDVGPARPGVRSYVAFYGGLAVPRVLGSRRDRLLSGTARPGWRPGTCCRWATPAAWALGRTAARWGRCRRAASR